MGKLSDYIKYTEKQQLASNLMGTGAIVLLGGSKYGGKSRGAINIAMEKAYRYPGIKVTISRHLFKQVMDNFWFPMVKLFPPSVFKYVPNQKHQSFFFKNGSVIKFTSFQHEKDSAKEQGIASDLTIADEATLFHPSVIQFIIIHNRVTGGYRSEDKPFIPSILFTANPGGLAHNYFKYRFTEIDYSKWTPDELKVKDKYIYIPAGLYDNSFLTPAEVEDYENKLGVLPEAKRKALLYGDWNAYEGAFFEEYDSNVHVIEPFDIPEHWHKVIGFDYGGGSDKHPSAVMFLAQDPKTLRVYAYKELALIGSLPYVAEEILKATKDEKISGWWADPQIFKDRTESAGFVNDAFMSYGIPFEPAKNARLEGWAIFKAWLHHTPTQLPMFQIFNTCHYLTETMPVQQYSNSVTQNKEDMNSRGDDDMIDAARYGLIRGFELPSPQQIEYANRLITPNVTVKSLRNYEVYNNNSYDSFYSDSYNNYDTYNEFSRADY